MHEKGRVPPFVYFSRVCPRDLGPDGHGAPPQACRHLNLRGHTLRVSHADGTKLGGFVTAVTAAPYAT